MTIKQQVTLQEAVDFLNEAFKVDGDAMSLLVSSRVPCNADMAAHPTIQVGQTNNGYEVGLLGILNGLFGADEQRRGVIAVRLSESGNVSGFMRIDWSSQ